MSRKSALPLAHYGWFAENSGKWSRAVGQLRPNPSGLFDMHGNLWEWCHDAYGDYLDDTVDPIGTPSGAYHVNCGGGWLGDPASCRAAARDSNQATDRDHDLGFRLVLSSVQSRE